MIELQVQGLERCLEVGEVPNPADGFIYLSADVNLDAKGMAVEPRASVARGDIRQTMGCFEAKFFKYFHLAQFLYLHLLQV